MGGERAFLCDIKIYEDHRGKGYGKGALMKMEEFLRDMGVKFVELNMFGDNRVALELYRKMGYGLTSIQMLKEI